MRGFRRFPYIIEAIEKQGNQLKIADVGGGRGALSLYLAHQKHDVYVYDMDYNWDNQGDRFCNNRFMIYCADNGVKAQYGSVFNIPTDDDTFDVVISASVIEYILHKKYALLEMLRVLKPNGILVITYDLIQNHYEYPADERVEVFSPELIREVLAEIDINLQIHDDNDIAPISNIRKNKPPLACWNNRC